MLQNSLSMVVKLSLGKSSYTSGVRYNGCRPPVGQGVIYSLLAKPVDSAGNVAPSIYDVRLNHRRSLDQGMKNFLVLVTFGLEYQT